MSTPPVAASSAETRAELLKRSGRGYTKVRHLLCQLPDANGTSVLGPMVTDRKRRSLQAYLLLITVWPWLQKQTDPLPAAVWARALETAKGRRWSTTNVSEAWADLKVRGLVETKRLSRGVVVTPRREDGKDAYTDPGEVKADRNETYFSLPQSFWTSEWFETLSMPGLAMLLIIASRTSSEDKDETWLTNEDAGKWYGLSPRSVEGGIKELTDLGLVTERIEWVKAPLSAIGATKRHWFSLTGDFSTTARLAMQDKARQDRAARLKKDKKPTEKTAAKKATTRRVVRGKK